MRISTDEVAIPSGMVGKVLSNDGQKITFVDAVLLNRVDIANLAINGAIGTAVATVDVATNITFNQTTGNITATIPNPTNVSLHKTITLENLPASTQNLAFTATGGDSFSLAPNQSAEVIWNGTAWKLLSPQTQLSAEFGTLNIPAGAFTTANTTTYTDITGSNFTLPSAGTWRVTFNAVVYTDNGESARIIFSDSANNQQGNAILIESGFVGGNSFGNQVLITTTGSQSFKLRIATNNTTVNIPNAHQGTLIWEKISGFIPTTYSNVAEFGEVITNNQVGISATSGVYQTVSGGNFTLPSAGTWEVDYLYSPVAWSAGTAVSHKIRLFNVTTGAVIPNSQYFGGTHPTNTTTEYNTIQGTARITVTGATNIRLEVDPNHTGSFAYSNGKVTWKKISGFNPILGSSSDYGYFKPTTHTPSANSTVPLSLGDSNLILSGNDIVLKPNTTYKISASLGFQGSGGNFAQYFIADSNNVQLPNSNIATGSSQSSTNGDAYGIAEAIITTGSLSQNVRIRYNGSISGVTFAPSQSYVTVVQLGTTALTDLSQPFDRIRKTSEFDSDYFNGVTGSPFATTVAGTGATAVLGANTEVTEQGIMVMSTGTTSTGRAGILAGASILNGGVGVLQIENRINIIANLSNATERYQLYSGFADIATARPNNGVYFRYDDATSPNWILETSNNGVRSSTITSVAVGLTYVKLKVVFEPTIATFFINDVNVGTITTNLPLGLARLFSILPLNMIKSVGSTNRQSKIDYTKFRSDLTAVR